MRFPIFRLLTHSPSYRITRAFMIEEINSIKQKAAQADGSKKKSKKGKKTKK